jgi:Na+-transporting methylmalonyl-CoA/oxaloacetate decarboxylase gamma subunit
VSLTEKLLLGGNTAVIGMGIVFLVLVILSVIIAIQSKFVAAFFKGSFAKQLPDESSGEEFRVVDKIGSSTSGKTLLTGVDDESAALIMMIVSHHVNIPLNELKFKSIKAI